MLVTAPAVDTFRATILGGFEARARPFPWRHSTDPYAVLIGEVMLQRTRGEHAVKVYHEFLHRWPTPERLAKARVATIEKVIRPLGLIKRATLLKRLGRALALAGGVPSDPDQLARLPGVGPYAAHSVPVFAMGQDMPVVDWVIARVLRRYFGSEAVKRPNQDRALWDLATTLAALGNAPRLWLGTLDFAAAVCKPHPLCQTCPLSPTCHFAMELAA